MPDTPDAPVESIALGETKLYLLARKTPLLAFMAPDLPGQMAAETQLDEIMPRTEEDGDATRILINYTNQKQNSLIYKVTDLDRLDHTFTIDHYMNGYAKLLDPTALPEDPIDLTNLIIISALSSALMAVLDLGSDPTPDRTKAVSLLTMRSLVAIVYDDPLDVMIMAVEGPSEEDPVRIQAIWAVKARPALVQVEAEEAPTESVVSED